jgi:two-component system chemotaxis response regulator CheY
MEKILIVDDSPAARMIARRCLRIAGSTAEEFLEAEHGRAALDVLKHHKVHLVIADLNMPVMDGQTLIRFMRSSPRLNEIPVVVVSSLVNPSTAEGLKQLGATVVLRKPLNPASMADALESVRALRGGA